MDTPRGIAHNCSAPKGPSMRLASHQAPTTRARATSALAAFALLIGLTACSSSPSGNSAPAATTETSAHQESGTSVEISESTIILDVRTEEEFLAGYLEGAQLLDFNNGNFAAAIPTLDPEAEYLIYCRSGNRAGQAISQLEQASFTNLTNLGSLEEAASATGIQIMQ